MNSQPMINCIKDFIVDGHTRWRYLDAQVMPKASVLQKDPRIHCVLYFLPPHRMKIIDCELISQLAPLVPIIPVIAKSDTMTTEEHNQYLLKVKEILGKNSKQIGSSHSIHLESLIFYCISLRNQ